MNAAILRWLVVPLLLLMILTLFPVYPALAGAAAFSGSFDPADPRFDAPDAGTCVQMAPDDVYYDVHPFYVDSSGVYTMGITQAMLASGGDDTVLGLYADGFDPSRPEINCVAYNSDFDPTYSTYRSMIDRQLEPGMQYLLVVMSFYDLDVGTYRGQIVGPGTVMMGWMPPQPPSLMSSRPGLPSPQPVILPASGPASSRINDHEVYSPVALFAEYYDNGQLGLHIYNIGSGSPESALVVPPEMISSVPEFPEQNTLIAQTPDGLIQFFRLDTGWFQVNAGPDVEGKVSCIAFDRLCIGPDCATYITSEYRTR